MSNKGILSRMYKEYSKFHSKSEYMNKYPNIPVRIWAKVLVRHVTEKDILMTDKHMKRCSKLNKHQGNAKEIKTHHYTLYRVAKNMKK